MTQSQNKEKLNKADTIAIRLLLTKFVKQKIPRLETWNHTIESCIQPDDPRLLATDIIEEDLELIKSLEDRKIVQACV